MNERFVHRIRVEQPPVAETLSEARERLRERFPPRVSRRMTHLGLLLGAALDDLTLGVDDACVYASSFAETRALEEFLGSFPAASPLWFQTSIHPGGVQQVLIGRQEPIQRLWPLAGRARLVEDALLIALLEPAERVVLLGGEERGTWMLERAMASAEAYAFAVEVRRQRKGAIACIAVDATDDGRGKEAGLPESPPSLAAFAQALGSRQALSWRGTGGVWKWEWL